MIDPLAQAEQALVLELAKVKAFSTFQKAEVWRLFMDGKHQGRGKLGFENERGYMAGMMRGCTIMLQHLNQPLTPDLFEQLHDACVTNVLNRSEEPMKLMYRDSPHHGEGFGVDADTWSLAGYQELVAKYKNRNKGDQSYDDGKNTVGIVLADDPKNMVGPDVHPKVMKLKPLYRNQCKGFAASILERYAQEIQKIDPLEAIVRCCQDLDQVHLFEDGNIRTIAFLVLNKCLIEQNLSPTILDEPNIFDCKSMAEIQEAVKAGQKTFASYMTT
jgi:Fic/DOC family